MTEQKEPREFWIDEGWNGLDLGWYKRYVSEVPESGSTEKPNIIHVIEYEAYQKAVEALKEISEYKWCPLCKNEESIGIAKETLRELGVE